MPKTLSNQAVNGKRLSLEQGQKLVRMARKAIEASQAGDSYTPDEESKALFSGPSGCFVSVCVGDQLRGCTGFVQPESPLFEAIVLAAENAATRDYRFPPIQPHELPDLYVEVDILTEPVQLHAQRPEDYLEQVRVGMDGLLIEGHFHRGLLLPQVAARNAWDAETFLNHTCLKAGLYPQDWRDLETVQVFVFQAQRFGEIAPGGEIVELPPES